MFDHFFLNEMSPTRISNHIHDVSNFCKHKQQTTSVSKESRSANKEFKTCTHWRHSEQPTTAPKASRHMENCALIKAMPPQEWNLLHWTHCSRVYDFMNQKAKWTNKLINGKYPREQVVSCNVHMAEYRRQGTMGKLSQWLYRPAREQCAEIELLRGNIFHCHLLSCNVRQQASQVNSRNNLLRPQPHVSMVNSVWELKAWITCVLTII